MLLHRNDPDCLKLNEDIEGVADASRLNVDFLRQEGVTLRNSLRDTSKCFAAYATQGQDAFPSMVAFLQDAEQQMLQLEQQLDASANKFSEMLAYFGDQAGKTSESFFATLVKFVGEFTHARDQYVRKKKAEDAQAARAKLAEARREAKVAVVQENKENATNNVAN